MNWKDTLIKAPRGRARVLSVFKVSELVREATKEWSDTVTIGESFYMFNVRKNIVPFLEPKIRALLKENDEDRHITRITTHFMNANFKGLKIAENSKFDKTMFNVLVRHPNWIVKGRNPSKAEFKKVE
jgi:hypothetical protein